MVQEYIFHFIQFKEHGIQPDGQMPSGIVSKKYFLK